MSKQLECDFKHSLQTIFLVSWLSVVTFKAIKPWGVPWYGDPAFYCPISQHDQEFSDQAGESFNIETIESYDDDVMKLKATKSRQVWAARKYGRILPP